MATGEQVEKKKAFTHCEVVRQPKLEQIILPEGMDIDKAIEWMVRQKEHENATIAVHEEVAAYPLDGARALMEVLRRRFGWADAVPKKTFFGDQPPVMVSLPVAFGKVTQVIWGDFQVPGIQGTLSSGAKIDGGKATFVLGGKIKRKNEKLVHEIADQVREEVRLHSVYRGGAIRLSTDEKTGQLDMQNPPEFLDLSNVRPEELIFADGVQELIDTSLFCPLQYTQDCRDRQIPLKRGILLEGPYGTGKTLTAFVTAKKATDNGWTFIYLDRVSSLRQAIQFAMLYQPAVIFAEDIDRVVSGERDAKMDDIFNTIDGIDSKSTEVMVVLSTNHVERIHKAMLRPGRLDAVIPVRAPDSAAAERLLRLYSRDLLTPEQDIAPVATMLEGNRPAVLREVVERAKLAALWRTGGEAKGLDVADLEKAGRGMVAHLELLKEDEGKEEKGIEFGVVVGSSGGGVTKKMATISLREAS